MVIINMTNLKKSKFTLQDGLNSRTPIETLKVIDKRFQIKNVHLGEGSFGEVYACWDTQTKEVLAAKSISKVKLLKKINNSSLRGNAKDFYIKSLQDEAFLMKKFDHQNILRFYSHSETESYIYFYLEYCNQGTLADLIHREGKIAYEKALPIMKQIVSGCAKMHELNICHRDIKPQNILLHNGIAKLSDFGFAVCLDESESLTSRACVGSNQFIAPQIIQRQRTTLKCDVWSLGVTFYNLLYGCSPWNNLSNPKTSHHVIILPNDVFVPIWIKLIIQKMLSHDANSRPSLNEISSLLKF